MQIPTCLLSVDKCESDMQIPTDLDGGESRKSTVLSNISIRVTAVDAPVLFQGFSINKTVHNILYSDTHSVIEKRYTINDTH